MAPLDSAAVSPVLRSAPVRITAPVGIPSSPRRLGSALAAILLLAATASQLLAHAELVTSDPADGSVLDVPPTEVTLTFSDGLNQARSKFALADSTGATVGTGEAAQDGDKVMTLTDLTLTPSRYTIEWTSVALDGDVLRGTLSFTVNKAAGTATAGEATQTGTASEASPTQTAGETTAATPAQATRTPPAGEDAVVPSTAGDGDVLVPIVVGLLLVAALGIVVLRRTRNAG